MLANAININAPNTVLSKLFAKWVDIFRFEVLIWFTVKGFLIESFEYLRALGLNMGYVNLILFERATHSS